MHAQLRSSGPGGAFLLYTTRQNTLHTLPLAALWSGGQGGAPLAGALQAALRHSVLAGQGRRAATALAEAQNPAPGLSSTPSATSVASEGDASISAAEQRLERVRAALEATEREFEGHRAALVAVVAAEGGQAGAHAAAAAALLAAVDAGRRAAG